jgi:hypothetical protein
MKSIHRWSASVAVVALIALSSPAKGLASADDKGDLGDKIAGTYLAVSEDGAQVLQIGRDGDLSVIISFQFTSGGVLGDSFSNTLGSWNKTGKREITAGTANLAFRSGIGFVGVGAATYVIEFDRRFKTATVTYEGAIFSPGVNPFGADAEPIAGSGFTCRPGSEFHRIPIDGENDHQE